MITKDNILANMAEWFIYLSAPTTAISVLNKYDPTVAIIGAIGQVLAIAARVVWIERKGKKKEPRDAKYWISSIVLGAASAYFFANVLSRWSGLDIVASAIVCGALGQYAFDFIIAIKDTSIDSIKNIGNGQDKGDIGHEN